MKKIITIFTLILTIGLSLICAQNLPTTFKDTSKTNIVCIDKSSAMIPNLTGWSDASRLVLEEISKKYGKPDGVNDDELVWIKKGVWDKICVSKKETQHNFPYEHTDMLQTTINYKVPIIKMTELGNFDGSITFDRTQGTMSVRCDNEATNFLALNLAHDIITNSKTVEQARDAFGKIIQEKMSGGNPIYMQKILFTIQKDTTNSDKNTTGLTKAEVMKGLKKIGQE
jgi:hypothetical protein